MTYLIIGPNTVKQEEKVLSMISTFFGKEVSDIQSFENIPDIHILDGREQNSLGIEEVKKFQNEMVYKPFEEAVQIGLIWQSEKLTVQAQNSFLKTLEESDDNTIFLLCVNNEKNLLQTIISRSKPIYLSSLKNNSDFTRPDILDMDLVDQFKKIEEIGKSKEDCIELVNEIEKIYKETLNICIKEGDLTKAKETKVFLKQIEGARTKLNANGNKRLVLESLVIHLKSS